MFAPGDGGIHGGAGDAFPLRRQRPALAVANGLDQSLKRLVESDLVGFDEEQSSVGAN